MAISFDANTTIEARNDIIRITKEAVNYLKNPQNRQVLAHISKDLKKQSPAKFEQFRSFLISQDSEFIPIFKQLELEDGFRDAGLGDSDISDVDGDIIRGENGEIIDM